MAFIITAYPVISVRYNERHQSTVHTRHMEAVRQAQPREITCARNLASAYNETIKPGAQTVDAFCGDSLLRASKGYGRQLNIAGDGIMGYLKIPPIKVNLPIYHGTKASTLELGVGHLLGSSLPVGGKDTHAVLTAHSGMASQKMFSDLPKLKTGDVFYLDVLNERLAYQVDQIKTVLPDDTSYLGIEAGKDFCTLATCTPFAVNTHRLLVRGTRIPYRETTEMPEDMPVRERAESTWEAEYLKGIGIGLTLAAAICLVFASFRLFFRRRYRHG